jgi:hypothetical protein
MESDEQENPWRTLSSRKVYENNWIGVREDSVIRPDGEPGIYGVVQFKNIAVGVLAVEDDDSIYLVGQYRYTLGRYSWEILFMGNPGGRLPGRRRPTKRCQARAGGRNRLKRCGMEPLGRSSSIELGHGRKGCLVRCKGVEAREAQSGRHGKTEGATGAL